MTKNHEPTVQELFDLTGRVALVTGASGYLGSAMARAIAEAGATVVASSRNVERAVSVAESLPSPTGARHYGVELNHMKEASTRRGFASAVEKAGGVDILVNNGHEGLAKDWTTVTHEEFTRQLANASGYFLLANLLRDHALERRVKASVILLGSMYGSVGSYPDAYEGICAANSVAYQALKGGIIQMTRHLAVCWASTGVRVNCLSPGPFPNPNVSKELVDRLSKKSPFGRMGVPAELKGAVLFLASDASSYVTGQDLIVDGGWTAW